MSGIMNMFVAAKTTIATAVDEFFNRVTLLLNTSSTNGAQNNTFLDSGTANGGVGFTITRNGNTTQGTFTPFSQTGWSNYFNQSSRFSLDRTASSFGTNDFTVECWWLADGSQSSYAGLIGQNFNATNGGWTLKVFATTNIVQFSYISGGSIFDINTTSNVNDGAWHNIAITRSGTSLRIYIDGTLNVTGTLPSSFSFGSGAGNTDIGYQVRDNSFIKGYVSNLRLVNGTALSTGSTYTVATTPLTNITNTSLLTCQSNRFIDNSTANSGSPWTITVTGTPSVQAFSPFLPTAAYSTTTVGGSGYFDGTSDYLVFGSGQANANLNGDCSIELWFYPTGAAAAGLLTAKYGGTTNQFYVNSQSNNLIYCEFLGSTFYAKTSSGSFTRNAWNHLLITKSSTTAKMWLNGVYEGAWTVSTINSSTDAIGVGATQGGATTFNGYISGIRYSNTATETGTSNITLPTAPLTSNGNTAALLSFTNAGIFDAAAKNDLETVGGAQVSTTAKFGTTSMYFDGTDDRLVYPASQNFNFGTGSFTIEGWVYFAVLAANQDSGILQLSSGAGGLQANNSNIALRAINISGQGWGMYAKNAINNAGGTLPVAGQWYHFAMVRNGTNTNLYINGNSVIALTADTTDYSTYINLVVGGYYSTSYLMNGYIDDLRISKFARYTANFTAPTSAFPIQ